MTITLDRIQRYPVKGLGPDALEAVTLTPGAGLPHDRRFAVLRGGSAFDAAAPRWLPKQRFVMLMRDTALARIACRLDAEAAALELAAPERAACRVALADAGDRPRLDAWLNAILGARPEGPARLVEAGGQSFTDVPQNCLSLVNLASVRELEDRMGCRLDPLRFRANLYLEGAAPWVEFDWVGCEVQIGEVRVHVPSRIPRCAATSVDPATGTRDVNVVKGLRAAYGHYDMGVYAEVLTAGRVQRGDVVRPPDGARPRSWLGHWMRFLGFLARSAPIVLSRR
jgi:uncharacterized protein YcbX